MTQLNGMPMPVQRALELAEQQGFERSCLPAVGRLLRVLVAGAGAGNVGEIGTGCGVGAAWLLSGLGPGQHLYSIETDRGRHAAVEDLFGENPGVTFLRGDWRGLAAHTPFRFLFADGGKAKEAGEEVLALLAVGGTLLLDDLTPEALLPEAWRAQPDPVRAFWLEHPDVHATEVLTTPQTAAIIAVRRC